MKNNFFFILILIIIFTSGCSNLSRKDQFKTLMYFDETLKSHYDKWEIEEAYNRLDAIEKSDESKKPNINFELIREGLKKRTLKKEELQKITVNIKHEIEQNNVDGIKKYIDKTLFNVLKFKELKKYDFSGVKVYIGKVNYSGNKAEAIYGFYYMDEIYYYIIKFALEKDNWLIVDFVEKAVSG